MSFLGPSLVETCPGTQFFMFMTILEHFILAKDEVSQMNQRVKSFNPRKNTYDFIVVGGGSAGAVVARRLSDNLNWNVLLLEAGPDEPPGAQVPSMVVKYLGTDIDWQYRTTNETGACLSTGGSCSWPRGKNLGGTSVHNGMMYVRGHDKDYDDWEAMGNEGWSWREVLPYFTRSENNGEIGRVGTRYHGSGGPLNVERFPWKPSITDNILKAAKEAGYGLTEDLNGEKITGFTVAQTNSKNGVRVSSASAFLRPVRDRSNLYVALNATATKIIIENMKAVGVEYVRDGVKVKAYSSREVIVSAGAVDSPKLLLLSGIGPKNHLESVKVPLIKDLPGVGENLHNHVSYQLNYEINQPNVYDLDWPSVVEYIAHQRGPMSSTGLSQITGVVASKYTTPDHPDLQFYFGGYQADCASTGIPGDLVNSGSRLINISPTNLHPLSRGHLRLASNDPLAKPIIWGNYLDNQRDVDVLVEAVEIARKLMNSTSMRMLNATLIAKPINACSEFEFLSKAYWACAVRQDTGPENHQAGSCKMGPADDPLAVVDSRLRVHGIQNLRVADTSIMPKVTSGNTAAPAMMIGERVVSFIKEQCKLPGHFQPGSYHPSDNHHHHHHPYHHNPYHHHPHHHNPYHRDYPHNIHHEHYKF